MIASKFSDLIAQSLSGVVGRIVELENGKPVGSTRLLHKEMLREHYSVTLQWNSHAVNQSIVAADVVEMDSSSPLKSRGTLRAATGAIPKLAMKYRKGEREISKMNILQSRGANEAQLVAMLMADAKHGIQGVDVRKEIMFQQALSSGQILLDDPDDPSLGIRVTFGYKPENQLNATKAKWGDGKATPIDDLLAMFFRAEAHGHSLGLLMMDEKTFNQLRSSQQGATLCASVHNRVITAKDAVPTASRAGMIEALQDEFGVDVKVVNSSFQVEKRDGTRKQITPWESGMIVGLPNANAERLVYGTLAEETNPVPGVQYTKAGTHTLVSMYRETDPLRETTAMQALCLRVINGVESIYQLNTTETA